MNAATHGARRITEAASRAATVTEIRPASEPVVDATFTSLCATVLLAAFIAAAILAMGSARPVPLYGVVGSAIFGTVLSAFLVGALHLAVTDSRRHKDGDH